MIKRRACLNFFIIDELFSEKKSLILNKMIHNSEFMERILVNSLPLYNKLQKIVESNIDLDKKTEKTLIKYILRMATRPQPYALNSGICISNEDKFNNYKKEVKEILVSLEWIEKIIPLIENTITASSEIKVTTNPLLYKKGTQYVLESNNEYIYVNSTNFLESLFKMLEKSLTISQILRNYNNENLNDEILRTIKRLLKNKILKSELNQNSINYDCNIFFEQIRKLKLSDEKLKKQIEDINFLYQKYNETEIGEGAEIYISLIEKMETVCKANRYISINLYFVEDNTMEIEQSIDLEKSITMMNYFDKLQLYNWKEYYLKFLDKYGYYVKIPLLEMLDAGTGIGKPSILTNEKINNDIEQYILNKVIQTIFNRETTLSLKENDFDNLKKIYEKKESHERLPITFDAKIIPFDKKFIIHPNSFSFPKNSYVGRFAYDNCDRKILQEDSCSEVNYISNRYSDIGITYKSASKLFIDCIGYTSNSSYKVPLNEIYTMIIENNIYLTYNNELIYPVFTQLLVYRNSNEHSAILFLQEYSRYIFEYPSNFPTDKFFYLEYIPRIEYKNLILSPSRINIVVNNDISANERRKIIKKKLTQYKFDRFRYVYILEGDKALPALTNNDLSLELMEDSFTTIMDGKSILTIMEAPELKQKQLEIADWIYSSSTEEVKERKKSMKNIRKNLDISTVYQDHIDFNWSSYYIYYGKGKLEKVERLLLDFFIESDFNFFIVNFKDLEKKEHIRLRYKKNYNNIDEKIETYLLNLIEKGDINTFEKNIFRPEVNRYGGNDIWPIVYELFCINTRTMLIFKQDLKSNSSIEQALYLSSYMFYELFDGEIKQLLKYLDIMYPKNSNFVKSFAKKREEYLNIVLTAIKYSQNHNNKLLVEKRKITKKLMSKIQEKELPIERVMYLIKSIIHMEINRYFPFNKYLEEQTNQYMRFSFFNLSYQLGGER